MEKFCHRGGRRGIDTFLKPDQIHVKVLYIKAENFKCIFSSHSLTASEQIRRFRRSVGWKLQHRCCGQIWRGAVIVSSLCAYLLNTQVLVCGLNNYNQLGVAEVKCFDGLFDVFLFAGVDLLHASGVSGLEQSLLGRHCYWAAPCHWPSMKLLWGVLI